MSGTRTLFVVLLAVALSSIVVADEKVHVLQRGETIFTLARRYSVSADELQRYNDIADPTRLPVGARIRIPNTYVVRPGDYIYSIAQRLGVGWLTLLEVNGLGRNDVVRPGDVLIVPRTATATSPAPADRQTTPPAPARTPDPTPSTPAAAPIVTAARPDQSTARVEWPHPGERSNWTGKFPGVVMAGAAGDLIRSVTSGTVAFVSPISSFGRLVLVQGENGFLYGYAGAERLNVAVGDRVEVGTVLGSVGFSPAFDATKVLFTVWHINRYIDPNTAPRG